MHLHTALAVFTATAWWRQGCGHGMNRTEGPFQQVPTPANSNWGVNKKSGGSKVDTALLNGDSPGKVSLGFIKDLISDADDAALLRVALGIAFHLAAYEEGNPA